MTDAPIIQRTALPQPPHILAANFRRRPYPFLLDSGVQEGGHGRFSFFGSDPFLVVRSHGREVRVSEGGSERVLRADPLDVLQSFLERHIFPKDSYPVPFIGGAVGYLGYDIGRLMERLPGGPVEDVPIPESYLCFYDAVVAYDHALGQGYLVSNGLPEPPGLQRTARAERRLADLEALLHQPACDEAPSTERLADILLRPQSNFTREGYLQAVRRAKEYIVAGDIYQVNLSQRFKSSWGGSPWELYSRLREINPAPFAAFQDFGDLAVVSASPERFLRLSGDSIETRPIKGTRPRGMTPIEDGHLAEELLTSEKDRAEHIMIVDLERSDLGRVSTMGSVTVQELMSLERFATVFHLTSTIHGRLRPGARVADLLRATFPGGSITGAPKIRAMEIIDELEPTRRGVYTGAIGYFSANGDVDLNIAIRSTVVKDGVAYFQVGGGIVYDSDPEGEFLETLDKGRALMEVLAGAPLRA